MASISPGRVLWIVLGPRGNYEPHPAVAINSPDSEGYFYIVGGSTKHALDRSTEVELPWSSPVRHPLTKLKRQTFADANWIVKIHEDDVLENRGQVPPSCLVEIQNRIRKINPSLGAKLD